MALIKIEVTSQNQGDGKGIIAREICDYLGGVVGVRHALMDETRDEYVVEISFDVLSYSMKGEFQ